MGLARQRENLSAAGFPSSVIATIQAARAVSTRTLYGSKWGVFEEWCQEQSPPVVSFQASVKDVLVFLQGRLDLGNTFSTVNVYLAAISACHLGFDGKTVGRQPLVVEFLKGAKRASRVSRSLFPKWDLALVLDSLSRTPFEPLETVELKFLTFKTVLLIALTTAKRVSDIHALSVSPECMRFADDGGKVVFKPNSAFVPKNPQAPITPTELAAFHPPPFASEEDRRLHCLCPVRALRLYVQRTAAPDRPCQLFVSLGPKSGKAVAKSTLSRWIVDAIRLAYTSRGAAVPDGLRAHSTRGMSASWALCRGVSIQDVCAAASWSSPSTFATYYNLDVAAASMAHAVLGVASTRQ